jgi:hypothetical protein
MSPIYDRNNLLVFCDVGVVHGKPYAARQVYLACVGTQMLDTEAMRPMHV